MLVTKELQWLIDHDGVIDANYTADDIYGINKNSSNKAYIEFTSFSSGSTIFHYWDKLAGLEFNSYFKENGKTYYFKNGKVNRIAASFENADIQSITVAFGRITNSLDWRSSFSGDDFVVFQASEFFVDGNRKADCTRYANPDTSLGQKGFSKPSTVLDLKGGQDRVAFRITRGTRSCKGKAYLDDIYFDLTCGFKAMYDYPATGQSSAGTFSGDSINTIWESETTKTLTFTTNPGYRLIGWQKNNVTDTSLGDKSSISVQVDGSTRYRPIVTEIKHEIILKANETDGDTEGIIYNNGESLGISTYVKDCYVSTSSSDLDFSTFTAYKKFYTFTGWKYNGTTTSSLTLKASDIVKDTNLKREYVAQYKAEDYNYVLVGKDYQGSVTTGQNNINAIGTFPSAEPRIGYDWVGWIADDGQVFAVKDQIPFVAEPRTYTASFKKKVYTLTFIKGEGSWVNGTNPSSIEMDSDPVLVKIPTIPGYKTGWEMTREQEDGTTITEIISAEDSPNHWIEVNSKTTGHRVYTAFYEPINYKLNYSGYSDPNNLGNGSVINFSGEGGPKSISYINDGQFPLNNSITAPGYELVGWVSNDSSNKNPSLSLHIDIEPNRDPYQDSAERSYTAYFKPIEYNIDFYYNEPAEEPGSAPVTPATTPPNKVYFPKMTVETVFTNSISPPSANGYIFDYWRVYVKTPGSSNYKEIVEARSKEIVPTVLKDSSGNWILGDYKYVSIYKPKVFNISYRTADPIHQKYIDDGTFVLRKTYKTNKNRSLLVQDYDDLTPVSIPRPGFEFIGFKRKGSLESPNVNYILEANNHTQDLEFELVFKEHNITIEVIPMLLDGDKPLTPNFVSFEDEEDNNGIPWAEFSYEGKKAASIEKNSINLDFEDGQKVHRKLNYNKKRYVFIGWDWQGDGEGEPLETMQEDCDIDVRPTVDNLASHNKYYAIFSYVKYTVTVRPMNQTGAGGKYGALLIDKKNTDAYFEISEDDMLSPENLEKFNSQNVEPLQNSVRFINNEYNIENLHFRDEIVLAMTPYAILNDTEINKRYIFETWESSSANPSSNVTLKITVGDDSWFNSTTKVLNPMFKKVDFTNTVKKYKNNTSNDLSVLNSILDKSIDGFVLINTINLLGEYGFYQCSNLKYAFLPGVGTIKKNAFDGCSKLSSLILSSSEHGGTGDNSFLGCSNLNLMILPSQQIALQSLFSPDDTNKDAENNWSLFQRGLGRIYVPESLLYVYLGVTNWCNYANIIRPIPTTKNNNIYNEPIPEPDEI